jgi:hypothetical protein
MIRRGLLAVTLATLALTGIVLVAGGRPGRPSWQRRARASPPAPCQDALGIQAALRYRQCQPHHWRACLLHP